jgi:DNA-binding response OmpR family regulator
MTTVMGGVRVLVVDDEPTLLDLLQTLLDLADFEVLTAANGREALTAVEASAPKVMVLDLNMPGLDGFAVLQALRDKPPAVKPKVLVLTARNAPEDVRRASVLGADDYLSKPFANKILLARVQRLAGLAP